MIMIVKALGSQMGFPATAEGGGEVMGGGGVESGERNEVQARSSLTSTVPKARSRSREVATLDETLRISLRVSYKLPTLAWLSTTVAFTRTLASWLTLSKPEERRRAEGLEEAL